MVTIIIPTYSRPDYIERAVLSVLSQTHSDIELIVVDDNGIGTEYQLLTESLLKKYIESNQIVYLKHDINRNGSAARNTGIRASHGEFITFLDDDDVLHPDKIRKEVEAICNNDGYEVSYCGFRILLGEKELKSVKPTEEGNLQYDLLTCRWGIGTGSNPMFSRKVFDRIGLFDESFTRHQDIEFMVRVFRVFKIKAIPDVLIDRYIDSRINSVNYQKFIPVKEKFLNTFKEDIEKYSIKEKNTIYRNQYADIACHAMQNKAYKAAWQFYKKANSFRMLSLRIIAKGVAYGFLNFKTE